MNRAMIIFILLAVIVGAIVGGLLGWKNRQHENKPSLVAPGIQQPSSRQQGSTFNLSNPPKEYEAFRH